MFVFFISPLAMTDAAIGTVAAGIAGAAGIGLGGYFSWRKERDPAEAETHQEQIVSTRQLWRDTVDDIRKLREKQERYLEENGDLKAQVAEQKGEMAGLTERVRLLEADLSRKEAALEKLLQEKIEKEKHLHDMRNRAHAAELKVVSLQGEANSLSLELGRPIKYTDAASVALTNPTAGPSNP